MTAGNPSGTLMPRSDMRVGTVTFQDWTDGSRYELGKSNYARLKVKVHNGGNGELAAQQRRSQGEKAIHGP